jgi:uncharacterized damage-inducible protein DinB
MNDSVKIAELSRAVRESTIKRLKKIPGGFENWKPSENALSIADIAHHLIEADQWLFRKLDNPSLQSMTASAGEAGECDSQNLLQIINNLEELGRKRASMIEGMTAEDLNAKIYDDRFGGEVTVWWLIVRGNLDHETHHRGQLAAYLRMISDKK